MNLRSYYSRITRFALLVQGLPAERDAIVSNESETLLQLRKDEILLGRDSDGIPFMSYLDDPFFKSNEQAEAYARWKGGMEREHNARIVHVLNFPNKDFVTPNLIIRGDFHDSLSINVSGSRFIISSNSDIAADINAKYRGLVYDPSPIARNYFWRNILFPALYRYLWQ